MSASKKFTTVKKSTKKNGNVRAAQFEDGDETADSHHFFAITGFPKASKRSEVVEVSRELIRQLLGEFSLEVHGVTTYQDGGFAVAVKYFASQGEALESKVSEVKGLFQFQGFVLVPVIVEDQFATQFAMPASTTAAPKTSAKRSASTDLSKSPTVDEFIGNTPSGALPAVQPLPGFTAVADVAGAGANVIINTIPEAEIVAAQAHAGMAVDNDDDDTVSEASEVEGDVSLKDVMRNINTLKKQQKQDTKRTREKTRVMIAEAIDPVWDQMHKVHGTVGELSRGAVLQDNRIGKLESELEALKLVGAGGASSDVTGNPNPNDPGLRQIAFKEFPNKSTIDERITAMKDFMRVNFPEIQHGIVDCFVNKEGEYTRNGFIEVSDRRIVRRVTTSAKDQKLQCRFAEVKIKPGTTAIDRNRNWALYAAEDEIKKVAGKRVVTLKRAEGRGVYVDGSRVFSQEPRFARDGVFHGEFQHLKLRK